MHPANTIDVAAQLRNGRRCVFEVQVTVAGGRSGLVGSGSSPRCRCLCCPPPSRSTPAAPPSALFRSGCSPGRSLSLASSSSTASFAPPRPLQPQTWLSPLLESRVGSGLCFPGNLTLQSLSCLGCEGSVGWSRCRCPPCPQSVGGSRSLSPPPC